MGAPRATFTARVVRASFKDCGSSDSTLAVGSRKCSATRRASSPGSRLQVRQTTPHVSRMWVPAGRPSRSAFGRLARFASSTIQCWRARLGAGGFVMVLFELHEHAIEFFGHRL